MDNILGNISGVLEELERMVSKYRSLGKMEKRKWDRLRFGAEDLDTMRGKLTFHTSAINLFMSSLKAGSLARIELAIEELVIEVRAGRRSPTVLSVQDDSAESSDAWRELEAELLDSGVTKKDIERNRDAIRSYIKSLVSDEAENVDSLPNDPISSSIANFMGVCHDSASSENLSSVSQRALKEDEPNKKDEGRTAVAGPNPIADPTPIANRTPIIDSDPTSNDLTSIMDSAPIVDLTPTTPIADSAFIADSTPITDSTVISDLAFIANSMPIANPTTDPVPVADSVQIVGPIADPMSITNPETYQADLIVDPTPITDSTPIEDSIADTTSIADLAQILDPIADLTPIADPTSIANPTTDPVPIADLAPIADPTPITDLASATCSPPGPLPEHLTQALVGHQMSVPPKEPSGGSDSSGFEVIGIVLSAWHVLLKTLALYKDTKSGRGADLLRYELKTEEIIYMNLVRHLLASGSSEANLIQLSDRYKPNLGLWRDKALNSILQKRLGHEKSEVILKTLREMDGSLTCINDRLGGGNIDMVGHHFSILQPPNSLSLLF